MTGLDQDMMQKNLTCKNLRAAQKDMCSYGVLFVPVNFLFLALGVLLLLLYQKTGVPVYYKYRLTSIYTYLKHRFGHVSYKTGSSFFILSKLLGAAAKFYVVCRILQMCLVDSFSVPYVVIVLAALFLIWLYTRRSGIRALVWTDFLQTLCLMLALVIMLLKVMDMLDMNMAEAIRTVWNLSLIHI